MCTLLPSITFPLKIFLEDDEELSEYYLDTTDENVCNWLMFIPPATSAEEQNLICYQVGWFYFTKNKPQINFFLTT